MNISNESIIEHIDKAKERIKNGDSITLDDKDKETLLTLLKAICNNTSDERMRKCVWCDSNEAKISAESPYEIKYSVKKIDNGEVFSLLGKDGDVVETVYCPQCKSRYTQLHEKK
ncbi:MAG: hypothetical protein JXO44_10315 [Clostridia bacterium]|nr:hypothetical protein [Clostridia bacterium]